MKSAPVSLDRIELFEMDEFKLNSKISFVQDRLMMRTVALAYFPLLQNVARTYEFLRVISEWLPNIV